MFQPELYQKAIRFAAKAHQQQKMPGSELPYLLHLTQVCGETIWALSAASAGLDCDWVVQCALLHDSIEDTAVTEEILEKEFGKKVMEGVLALTKNAQLPKAEQMLDSLQRIVAQGPEIRIVKICDRIVNLQMPPHYWKKDKKIQYQAEARLILDTLGGVHPVIEQRLADKIMAYTQYIED